MSRVKEGVVLPADSPTRRSRRPGTDRAGASARGIAPLRPSQHAPGRESGAAVLIGAIGDELTRGVKESRRTQPNLRTSAFPGAPRSPTKSHGDPWLAEACAPRCAAHQRDDGCARGGHARRSRAHPESRPAPDLCDHLHPASGWRFGCRRRRNSRPAGAPFPSGRTAATESAPAPPRPRAVIAESAPTPVGPPHPAASVAPAVQTIGRNAYRVAPHR